VTAAVFKRALDEIDAKSKFDATSLVVKPSFRNPQP
jgi:hypothetical protein